MGIGRGFFNILVQWGVAWILFVNVSLRKAVGKGRGLSKTRDPVYCLQGNIKKVQMLECEIVCFLMTQTC